MMVSKSVSSNFPIMIIIAMIMILIMIMVTITVMVMIMMMMIITTTQLTKQILFKFALWFNGRASQS